MKYLHGLMIGLIAFLILHTFMCKDWTTGFNECESVYNNTNAKYVCFNLTKPDKLWSMN